MPSRGHDLKKIMGNLLTLFRLASGKYTVYAHASNLSQDETAYRRFEGGQNFQHDTIERLGLEFDLYPHELYALAAHCKGLPPADLPQLCKRIGIDYNKPHDLQQTIKKKLAKEKSKKGRPKK